MELDENNAVAAKCCLRTVLINIGSSMKCMNFSREANNLNASEVEKEISLISERIKIINNTMSEMNGMDYAN